jgi:Xaa-Pro dipeptidase
MPAPPSSRCIRRIARLQACANGIAIGNIIAFGTGAAILHYTTLGRRRDVARPSFLIDAGAQYRGYASDITRTHAAQRGADPQFLELLSEMDVLQQIVAAVTITITVKST